MLWMKNFLRQGKPAAVLETSDRDTPESVRDLTPEKIDGIMADANSGDPRDQSRLAADLLEKNCDIMQAFSTRKNAVLGCPWRLEPGDGSAAAKKAAEALEKELRECGEGDGDDTFEDLLEDLLGALLPGFAVSEILWQPGGSIGGFHHIEQVRFTFRDGYFPRLVTRDEPQGLELPRRRIIFHKVRFHGGDPARGGLIRPLAWLHCFKHVGEKDLLGFIERHGMPFITAMVDETAFNTEKNAVKRLIRNFGSSGGGIFTKNVELKLLECSATGDVYFRLLEYLDAAVNKVILGQTASSGDSSGLSKGDAQSKVRQDILESDCRTLQRVIDSQVIKPWMRFNFGGGVPLPHLMIDCSPPEDKEKIAAMVKTLHDAGLDCDPEEVGKLVGLKLRSAAPAQDAVTLGAEEQAARTDILTRIAALARDESLSDEDFKKQLLCLASEDGDAALEDFETVIQNVIAAGIAAGRKHTRRMMKK